MHFVFHGFGWATLVIFFYSFAIAHFYWFVPNFVFVKINAVCVLVVGSSCKVRKHLVEKNHLTDLHNFSVFFR